MYTLADCNNFFVSCERVFRPDLEGKAVVVLSNNDGCAEIMHACSRGENIVVIFINNAIYGMTGGQMAPTTLLGQVTATTPYGRKAELNGYPMKITELIAQLEGTCYVTRQSVLPSLANSILLSSLISSLWTNSNQE